MTAKASGHKPTLCRECRTRKAESRAGWCRPCLRKHIREELSPGYVGPTAYRTADKRQERGDEANPWQENAIRALE